MAAQVPSDRRPRVAVIENELGWIEVPTPLAGGGTMVAVQPGMPSTGAVAR
jgi:hypothetical protein